MHPKGLYEQWQISPPGFDLYHQTGRSVMRKAEVCPQNFLSWLPDEQVLAPLTLFPSSWLGGPEEDTSGAAGEPCPRRCGGTVVLCSGSIQSLCVWGRALCQEVEGGQCSQAGWQHWNGTSVSSCWLVTLTRHSVP